MSSIVSNERLDKGKEIRGHLKPVYVKPWFYIYIKNAKPENEK